VVGGGYTLQVLGQKSVHPTIAALIMSTESVFAVFFGWILLGEQLTARELAGCILMFAAILVAQLPSLTQPNLKKSSLAENPVDFAGKKT